MSLRLLPCLAFLVIGAILLKKSPQDGIEGNTTRHIVPFGGILPGQNANLRVDSSNDATQGGNAVDNRDLLRLKNQNTSDPPITTEMTTDESMTEVQSMTAEASNVDENIETVTDIPSTAASATNVPVVQDDSDKSLSTTPPTSLASTVDENKEVVSEVESTAPSTTIAPVLDETKDDSDKYSSASWYVPGQLSVSENGLKLSTGLKSRLLAESGQKVIYHDGNFSVAPFHRQPDGAAIFVIPDGSGWIYASNAEDKVFGGVGAITFNSDGGIVKYENVLSGTARNCQGGTTPWNTWVSCEENDNKGQCWETDPFGAREAQKTVLGGKGGNFEAVACDSRDPLNPIFYVTNDKKNGELRRFTPDPKVVAQSMNGGDKWDILSKPGTMEYLLLEPESKSDKSFGYVSWTKDIKEGQKAAEKNFRRCEGMEYENGKLYFVSSTSRALFTIDLDSGTYFKTSTQSTEFVGTPDVVCKNGDIVYVSEETENKMEAGVYAIDAAGEMQTILRSVDWAGDATGLAFSPDNMFLYVVFQDDGKLFEISRLDGRPFDGAIASARHYTRGERNTSN